MGDLMDMPIILDNTGDILTLRLTPEDQARAQNGRQDRLAGYRCWIRRGKQVVMYRWLSQSDVHCACFLYPPTSVTKQDDRILAVTSVCWCQKNEAIIRNDFVGPNPDGSYKWALQTEGGIYHEQRGSLQPSIYGSPDPALVVEGQYQYTAPDGQVINLLYKADENGFQPTGDHLPTPPPIPPAIARALAYLATKPPPTDSDY